MDLSTLSTAELEKLKSDIETALVARRKQDLKDAREAVKATAAKFGFALADLLDEDTAKPASKASRAAVAPKYRHPENPALTWSGRGRKPQWFVAALEAGKSAADLEI